MVGTSLTLALLFRPCKKEVREFLLAEAETVGYAMFPSWEIWDDVAGYRSGSWCRCKCGSGWHACATR